MDSESDFEILPPYQVPINRVSVPSILRVGRTEAVRFR